MRARICGGRVSRKPEDLPIMVFSLSCRRTRGIIGVQIEVFLRSQDKSCTVSSKGSEGAYKHVRHDAVYERLKGADNFVEPTIICEVETKVGWLLVSCQLGLPCRLLPAFRLHTAQGLCQAYSAVMRSCCGCNLPAM